jgi:hypothetical protein
MKQDFPGPSFSATGADIEREHLHLKKYSKMNEGILTKIGSKLYRKQWQIGLCRADIRDIINSKKFYPEIRWIPVNSLDYYQSDPFIIPSADNGLTIAFEDYRFDDYYGKISLIKIDEKFNVTDHKVLIDTKSHLSYPFVFNEDNRTYLFPEAAHSGELWCYEYDAANRGVKPPVKIFDLPLIDPTILKHDNKYWLFGNMVGKDLNKKLYLFYSDKLFGPYTSHRCNPVKTSLNGCRPAGSFIKAGDEIYRPSQNCEWNYGESITLNRVKILNEISFAEEPYMTIGAGNVNSGSDNITAMHTINVCGDIIIVDGLKLTFSPVNQLKNFFGNRIDSLILNKMAIKADRYFEKGYR